MTVVRIGVEWLDDLFGLWFERSPEFFHARIGLAWWAAALAALFI